MVEVNRLPLSLLGLTVVVLVSLIVLVTLPQYQLPSNKSFIILWVTPWGGTSNYSIPTWAIPGVVVWYQCNNPSASLSMVNQQIALIQRYLSQNRTVFINLMCELPNEWRGLLHYITIPQYLLIDLMNIDPGGKNLYIGFSEESACVNDPACRATMVGIYKEIKALLPESNLFYYASGRELPSNVLALANEANLTLVGYDNYVYDYVNGTVTVPQYVIDEMIYLEDHGYSGRFIMGELGFRVCDQEAYVNAWQNPYVGSVNCTAPAIYDSQVLKQYEEELHPTFIGIWAWNGPPFGVVNNPLMLETISKYAETPNLQSITPPPGSIRLASWGFSFNPQGLIQLIVNYTLSTGSYVIYSPIPTIGLMPNELILFSIMNSSNPPNVIQVNGGPWLLTPALSGVRLLNLTSLASSMGMLSNGVEEAILASMFNGTLLSLPIDVYRSDLLYINTQLLREYNLPIPTTVEQLINDTQELANYGFTCIWVIPGRDNGQDQVNLWQSLFLGLASERYGSAAAARLMNELLYGTLNLRNSTIVQLINETNQYYLTITQYDCSGWQEMNWAEATSLLLQGAAVFQVGDSRLIGYALQQGTLVYPAMAPYINNTSVSIAAEPFPGTGGVYVIDVDSAVVPINGNSMINLSERFAGFWASYAGELAWVNASGGCMTWRSALINSTPLQGVNCIQLMNEPNYGFTISLSGGGLLMKPYSYLAESLLNLQEYGASYLTNFTSTLMLVEQVTYQGWVNAGKVGLGYLGYFKHPFAQYLPPWVNPVTYGIQSYTPWWASNETKATTITSISTSTSLITSQVTVTTTYVTTVTSMVTSTMINTVTKALTTTIASTVTIIKQTASSLTLGLIAIIAVIVVAVALILHHNRAM
ncbi:ABC transporter substrate-binding protein [Caldivirga sp. UBA161]|uniref:ABC transporter substrate-binding protein n=1 Tax=Caldivirga sp. UBA161 TaxID=1915569 RepID=UPI0025C12B1D|nr:ABC transporter substrate-binding protein [Caldivirga sp. UBA161]